MAPKRKYHVHPLNQKRRSTGEYHNLFPSIKRYPDKFKEYTRMNVDTFEDLLSKLEKPLTKNWTNFITEPILAEERLVVTLR